MLREHGANFRRTVHEPLGDAFRLWRVMMKHLNLHSGDYSNCGGIDEKSGRGVGVVCKQPMDRNECCGRYKLKN